MKKVRAIISGILCVTAVLLCTACLLGDDIDTLRRKAAEANGIGTTPLSGAANLIDLNVSAVDTDGVTRTITTEDGVYFGDLLSSTEWGVALTSVQIGELNFEDAGYEFDNGVNVTFSKVTIASKSKITFAVGTGTTKPMTFEALAATSLSNDDIVYFRVVSESGKTTVYYAFKVTGLAEGGGLSGGTSTNINGVKVGTGPQASANASVNGEAVLATLLTGTKVRTYEMPSVHMTGVVELQVNRPQGNPVTSLNPNQRIFWALKKFDDPTAVMDTNFIEFVKPATPPATGEALKVIIASNGLDDGDKIYLKSISGNGQTTSYYGWVIATGRWANIDSITIEGQEVILGTPGATWDDYALQAGTFDFHGSIPISGFAVAVVAEGKVMYAKVTGNADPTSVFADLPSGPIALATGDVLWFKVTSRDGLVSKFYKIWVYMEAIADVYYGQPTIYKAPAGGQPGDPPQLDPLWDDIDWTFRVNRTNLYEMSPIYKFLNTVDGHYNTTGYGHTEGKVKAYWDDNGLYVYGQMDFHDYYANVSATSPTARTTVLSPAASGTGSVADDNIHNYDSLEIFTNERLQAYTAGNFGIEYRIAPSSTDQRQPGTFSRISGYDPTGLSGNIAALRDSGNYYSWIMKDGTGKEKGYSVIAYIPWRAKTSAQANEVFTDGGLVDAEANAGPTIGVEFQLNTVTTGGTRDAILTWNGVTGQAYQQCRNYGKIKLILGDLAARGIVRGAKDPATYTVTFDKNGGETEAVPNSMTVTGSLGTLPTPPAKAGFRFLGWFTERTGGTPVTASTPITANIVVYAQWEDKTLPRDFTVTLTQMGPDWTYGPNHWANLSGNSSGAYPWLFDGRKVELGDVYKLNFTVTSATYEGALTVVLVDDSSVAPVNYWRELTPWINLGTVGATPIPVSVQMGPAAYAALSLNNSNLVFEIFDTQAAGHPDPIPLEITGFTFVLGEFEDVPLTDITLSQSSLSLLKDQVSAPLTVTRAPLNTTDNFTIEWSTSAPGIATVVNGVVTGVGVGTATITATAQLNGADYTPTPITANCNVVIQ